nr:MAG TPA: hypothetical protein [Caudoviricetes sp.]
MANVGEMTVSVNVSREPDTGSRIEADMDGNIDSLVELKSQVAELRDYLIGARGINGGVGATALPPEGFFGRLSVKNSEQKNLIGEIQDLVLEVRNYF